MDNLETIKSVLRKNGISCEIPASVPTNEHAQSRLCFCTGKSMLTTGWHIHVSNTQPLNNIIIACENILTGFKNATKDSNVRKNCHFN